MYKLLVLDDEPFVRRGIVSLVNFEELEIDTILEAGDGEKGLELIKKEEPDIILCDINMPGINGLELSEQIKKEKPWIKIAIITGYDYFEYARQALKAGVEDYVLKPVSVDDVYDILKNMIAAIKRDRIFKEIYKSIEEIKGDNEPDTTGYKKQFDELIDRYLSSSEFNLNFLADKTGFSVSYLSQLFKKIYGVSFSDYMINQRLEKSKLLLLTTSLKNYEIADKVGISDPNYFSTLFRKKYKDSPGKYKKRVQERETKR